MKKLVLAGVATLGLISFCAHTQIRTDSSALSTKQNKTLKETEKKNNNLENLNAMENIYGFKATASNGKEIDFAQFEGKVLLIVNTASKCGFTPQFDGLEKLNKQYRDKGLVVIGFPCNQFKEQDPGTDGEIEEFCRLNYGVTFQIMKKIDVNGENEHPIFTYLKEQAPTEEYHGVKGKATAAMLKNISNSYKKDSDIRWNFTKFLISRDGKTIKRYAPTTEPADFEKDIESML